tara:strand:+ start:586 stop:738 length:153 start_codon:yes stop_codon:yes gene_type:complete
MIIVAVLWEMKDWVLIPMIPASIIMVSLAFGIVALKTHIWVDDASALTKT